MDMCERLGVVSIVRDGLAFGFPVAERQGYLPVKKRRVSVSLARFSTAFTGKRDAYPTAAT